MEKSSGCAHVCTNDIGGFTCSCYDGYEINSDNKTCTQKGKYSIFFKRYVFHVGIYHYIFTMFLMIEHVLESRQP